MNQVHDLLKILVDPRIDGSDKDKPGVSPRVASKGLPKVHDRPGF